MNHRWIQSGMLGVVLLCGCAAPAPPPPPGYTGPLPSNAGQAAMQALNGRTITDPGGVARTLSGYMVGPQGAFIQVQEGTTTRVIYFETDGDVMDFHYRMTGSAHPTLSGTTSTRYVESWK